MRDGPEDDDNKHFVPHNGTEYSLSLTLCTVSTLGGASEPFKIELATDLSEHELLVKVT